MPPKSTVTKEAISRGRLINQVGERVMNVYGHAIGREIPEIVTPALLLDLPTARRNISFMASRMRSFPSSLRPHIKTHKSPDLARIQVEHGAEGLSVATVWEAAAMVAAGFDNIFLVNTVTGAWQIQTLAELALERRILVAVDDSANAQMLAGAARRAGSTIGAAIEIDTGMERAGVDNKEDAVALARLIVDLPGLRLEGLTGYEGHCSLIADRNERSVEHQRAMEFLMAVVDHLTDAGIHVGIRSAGGTATWDWTAAYPGITEIQAGSYAVMDRFHGRMTPEFECALTVATTVISRSSARVVVNAGTKSMGPPSLASVKGSDMEVVRFDEEHGILRTGGSVPELGQTFELVPGYAPTTVNLFDAYHVIEDGVVTDIWPVVPRGPGHMGLAQLPHDC